MRGIRAFLARKPLFVGMSHAVCSYSSDNLSKLPELELWRFTPTPSDSRLPPSRRFPGPSISLYRSPPRKLTKSDNALFLSLFVTPLLSYFYAIEICLSKN